LSPDAIPWPILINIQKNRKRAKPQKELYNKRHTIAKKEVNCQNKVKKK